MKPLDRGEEELFTIPAKSKYGDGVIIVTNFGLAVHTHKTGAILDLSHSEISSIEDAKDGKLCIKWIESSGHDGSLDITTKGSDGAYERISAARKESEKKLSEFDNSLDHETAHNKIRSNKVPASVPDEFVWHDCWYDAAVTMKYFIRFVIHAGSYTYLLPIRALSLRYSTNYDHIRQISAISRSL